MEMLLQVQSIKLIRLDNNFLKILLNDFWEFEGNLVIPKSLP